MPDHIYLYGPPGAGKTTIGKRLAEKLALPFLDLDQVVEQVAEKSIPEIFALKGEQGFRNLESELLAAAIPKTPSVIALGGGTLINTQNRDLVEASGSVILLKGEFETLYQRTGNAPDNRPLITEKRKEMLADLLSSRKDHYDSFPWQIDSSHLSGEDVIWACQVIAGRYHLASMSPSYDVVIKNGLFREIVRWLPAIEDKSGVFIISDTHVADLYAQQLTVRLQNEGRRTVALCAVPPNERAKSIKWLASIWNFLLDNGANRQSTILALGGGVVGDLAGFSAATYMRGIRWINVPTTLLGMVDAGIGGKTGVNLPRGKNLVGAFYPPTHVLIDPELLATLSPRNFSSGMAEVVKHAMLGELELLAICRLGPERIGNNLEEMISRAAGVKIRIVESDPYEMSQRQSLNLGHTIGHAIEKASRYKLTHGESVAIGLVVETFFAERIGIARKGLHQEISQILKKFYLPVEIPGQIPSELIIGYTQVDKKKSAGVLHFPLLTDVGSVKIDVHIPNLEAMLAEFRVLQ
jgi:shikimate kinase / 3-dehydroquinate synthase